MANIMALGAHLELEWKRKAFLLLGIEPQASVAQPVAKSMY
jgi:hypothetical protein